MYTATEQQLTLNTMVNFIAGQLKDGDKFKKTLHVKFHNGKSSHGGYGKGRPQMTIGLGDHGRHTNKEQWLAHLAAKKGTGYKRSWQEAVLLAQQGQWMFVEYSHIHKSIGIGGFVSDDPKVHSDALLAHELAHAVQFFCKFNNDNQFGTNYKAHQQVFKRIYEVLREKFINHRIGNPFLMDVIGTPEPVARPVLTGTPCRPSTPRPAPRTGDSTQTFGPRNEGAVATCWGIYSDLYYNEGIMERKLLIMAAVEVGMKKSTASAQYTRWRKSEGLV